MFFIGPPFGNYIDLPKIVPITGSYTLLPRPGLFKQVLLTLRYNFIHKDWVNKIGLRNNGIDYGIKHHKDDSIMSVAIMNPSEIPILLDKIPDNMNIEINISCPNVNDEKKWVRPEMLKGFLNGKRDWCIIKLNPTVNYGLIDQYYNTGFRQFHCSNTVPVPQGGLSGALVKKHNRCLIPYIKNKYHDVTVIGGGGIKRYSDVEEYQKMGADHFAFSSVVFCPYLFFHLYRELNAKK